MSTGLCANAANRLQGLGDPEPAGQRRILQLRADALPKLRRLRCRVEPENANRAAVGAAQALHALHGGRLAGAVRPEDAEDLASLDTEREVVDGNGATVGLAQVIHRDHGCQGRTSR